MTVDLRRNRTKLQKIDDAFLENDKVYGTVDLTFSVRKSDLSFWSAVFCLFLVYIWSSVHYYVAGLLSFNGMFDTITAVNQKNRWVYFIIWLICLTIIYVLMYYLKFKITEWEKPNENLRSSKKSEMFKKMASMRRGGNNRLRQSRINRGDDFNDSARPTSLIKRTWETKRKNHHIPEIEVDGSSREILENIIFPLFFITNGRILGYSFGIYSLNSFVSFFTPWWYFNSMLKDVTDDSEIKDQREKISLIILNAKDEAKKKAFKKKMEKRPTFGAILEQPKKEDYDLEDEYDGNYKQPKTIFKHQLWIYYYLTRDAVLTTIFIICYVLVCLPFFYHFSHFYILAQYFFAWILSWFTEIIFGQSEELIKLAN